MNILVCGGAASGKSEFAEKIAVDLKKESEGGRLFYLATMDKNSGGDTKERIAKHKNLRAGKEFRTIELCLSDSKIGLVFSDDDGKFFFPEDFCQKNATILLEDMGNLVARVVFSFSQADYFKIISDFISVLERKSENLVVVTNEIFLEELRLEDEFMRSYFEVLAKVNAFFARTSKKVVLVVAGIPLELSCESS